MSDKLPLADSGEMRFRTHELARKLFWSAASEDGFLFRADHGPVHIDDLWPFLLADVQMMASKLMPMVCRGIQACEHGVREGDWCSDCNADYKQAMIDNQE